MSAENCTSRARPPDVQEEPAGEIQLADLRAHLKIMLDAGKPLTVRRRRRIVAVVVPLDLSPWRGDRDRRKILLAARHAVIAHFAKLLSS